MKFLVVTCVLTVFASVVAALPSNCTTDLPRNSCGFYKECLEPTFPCGPSGYAIGYGDKYCNAFATHAATFTSQGQQWMVDVMHCLQLELVPLLAPHVKKTCPEIKKFAFGNHPKCYLQAGVCTLPVRDWIALARVIGFKQLVADLDSVKQELLVAINCPAKWLEAIVSQLSLSFDHDDPIHDGFWQ